MKVKAETDVDFNRIYRLIKIIESYERLVEYLLSLPMIPMDTDNLFDTESDIRQIILKTRLKEIGSQEKAAESLKISRNSFGIMLSRVNARMRGKRHGNSENFRKMRKDNDVETT